MSVRLLQVIDLVLDMKGHAANEIDWYEDIEAAYHGKDVSDITMVVLYADALAQMVDMHLSVTQRNQANLSVGDLRDVFRPFFNYRGFKHSLDLDIQNITRLDGRDLSNSGERYRERYRNERLLVVTQEMVDKHYRRKIDEHDRIGRLFSGFGDVL